MVHVSRPKRHLIYPFWIYSIGLYEAFRVFFISYYNSPKMVRLNESEDATLLDLLRSTINEAYPNPSNELEPKFINKFFNACHILFGVHPPGPDETVFKDYPRPEVFATEFFGKFERPLIQMALSIIEFGTTEVKIGNFYTVAEYLNDLRSNLENYTYNEVEDVTKKAIQKFGLLLTLIRDDDLMVKRLKIRATEEDARIKEFCQYVGKPVAENPRQIISLAAKMEAFLLLVQGTSWTQELARALVEDPSDRQMITELINDYSVTTGKNLFQEATRMRNQGIK